LPPKQRKQYEYKKRNNPVGDISVKSEAKKYSGKHYHHQARNSFQFCIIAINGTRSFNQEVESEYQEKRFGDNAETYTRKINMPK